MSKELVFAAICTLFLASCIPTPPPSDTQEELSQNTPDIIVQDDAPVMETSNVVYEGVVKPAGISIYQQGSHRLMLSDGRFILLESEAVDLNGYVNESVEVRGSLRPTVEAGGMIMRVDQARLSVEKEDEEQPPVEEEDADDDDLEPQEEDEEETDDDTSEEGAPEQQDDNDETDDDTPTEEPTPEPSEEPPQPQQLPSPELVPRIEQMASETFTSDQWTQQYCTAHIGFCIPVHRNWWFKSFGTTTSYLWHIELSSEEVAFLNSGPIHVNLVSGTVGAKKATDGQVRAQADSIVGFRSWTDNRHFEISAPPALEEAVTYITNHLSEYEGE